MNNVVSIISQKGGVGKSTVTTLLANIFYLYYNFKVAIIDADFPQNSIKKKRDAESAFIEKSKWFGNIYADLYKDREPYPIIASNLEKCSKQIMETKEDYDFVFVDVAGSLNQKGIVEFLGQVNHFYIPILQDDFSMKSALELYTIISTNIKPMSGNFRGCKLFFNRVPSRNKIESLTSEMKTSVDFVDDYLSAYSAYERVFRSTLFPIQKKDNPASINLFRFAESIKKSLEINNGGIEITDELKSELV